MVSQMDPKGTIPLFIVNWFAMRRPLQYMVALRDLAEERYAAPGRRRRRRRVRGDGSAGCCTTYLFDEERRRGHDRRISKIV